MISTKLGSLRKLINRYESYQRLYSKLGVGVVWWKWFVTLAWLLMKTYQDQDLKKN